MRNQGKVTVIFLFIALMLSCSSTTSSNPTLADEIVGDFLGTLQQQSGTTPNHSITVTEINDTRVQIAPTSGDASSTFEVGLLSQTNGSVVTIILEIDDIPENNGTFVSSTGRLSYALMLGSLEAFVGDKQ